MASSSVESEAIVRILDIARGHFSMDAAVLAGSGDSGTAVRYSCGNAAAFTTRLTNVTADRVLMRGTPLLLGDARNDPAFAGSEIGSIVAVAVERSDGSPLGVLACFSRAPSPLADDADAGTIRVLARAAATLVERGGLRPGPASVEPDAIRGAIDTGPAMVFQPIVSFDTMNPVGFEALARFEGAERRPDRWFADAARVDLGLALELSAVKAAVRHIPELPPDTFVSVNTSTRTAAAKEFFSIVEEVPPRRLLVELTDHASIEDDRTLGRALATLGAAGIRISTDVSDAGFETLSHLLQLAPDVIKLDGLLVRGIDTDPVRRALASTIVAFADDMGSETIGEMIEAEGEASMLRALGVKLGQGNLFGRPAPLT